jgi:CxxC motif-containing protein (DUF1111 family)
MTIVRPNRRPDPPAAGHAGRGRGTARVVAAVAQLAAACGDVLPGAPDPAEHLEGPIDGLSAPQRAVFVRGDGEFGRRFMPSEGLGPLFIAQSCDACHAGDGKGHPLFDITRFGRYIGPTFDPMTDEGGPQLQNRAILGYLAERVPAGATVSARFTPPAVTGLGLLEAVDDAAILSRADPNDVNGDGISGRPGWVDSTALTAMLAAHSNAGVPGPVTRHLPVNGRYLARFGKKATTITLRHQVVTAYSQDMGLTTDDLPDDLLVPGLSGAGGDDVADPEVGSGVVASVVFYLRTLREPPRRGAADPDVVAGEALFTTIGCAACHVPVMISGRSDIAALDQRIFSPFTDLLLHDMGPELDDGYTEGSATSSEWRTAPLWGIGLAEAAQGGSPFYLHDGRARTLRAAIGYHGGEGSASRAAFDALGGEDQARLLKYLRSL